MSLRDAVHLEKFVKLEGKLVKLTVELHDFSLEIADSKEANAWFSEQTKKKST